MNMRPNFTFPGLWPYVERAAGGRDLPHLGRCRGLWHCKQVQDALGQYPALDAESRRELLAHVRAVRDALAATVEGIDLAVLEAAGAVEAPAEAGPPPGAPEPSPQPDRAASPRRKRA